MDEHRSRVPLTIYLPEAVLERVAAIASHRGGSAAAEISQLVERAVAPRPRRRGMPRPSRRPVDTLTDGDRMYMLAMHYGGEGIPAIARTFGLAEDTTAGYLEELLHSGAGRKAAA